MLIIQRSKNCVVVPNMREKKRSTVRRVSVSVTVLRLGCWCVDSSYANLQRILVFCSDDLSLIVVWITGLLKTRFIIKGTIIKQIICNLKLYKIRSFQFCI